MDTEYRTPVLRNGLLVHMPYTTYAHWFLLRQLLDGAGVERVQVHFDIDAMSRAAFLCSFLDAVQAGRAHGFYVKYSKDFTIDQRRRIVAESRSLRAAERAALPAEERGDVDLILMKRLLGTGSRHGKWNDLWFEHPNPTMNEPHKAMCWLTPDDSLDPDAHARMFLAAGLARVDNVFQMTRRLINAFERPLGTSSSQNTVWHGYQPYNPAVIGKDLTIFRTVVNFISVGTDGKTPAMRLGLAKQPLTYEDILWPGETAPRPRRVRRKGRRLSGPRAYAACRDAQGGSVTGRPALAAVNVRVPGLPAAAKACRDRFELFFGDGRVRWQGDMHRLHVALMDLDVHGGGDRDAQFPANGSLRICQKLLPEVRVQGGLVDNLPQHVVATSHDILLPPNVRDRTPNRNVAGADRSPWKRWFKLDFSARSLAISAASVKYRFLIARYDLLISGVISRPSGPDERPARVRDGRAPWRLRTAA